MTHSKKWSKAYKASGWSRYPDTCQAIFDNIPREWGDRYTAAQLGEIAALLSALNDTDECPKTILYSLNPGDFDMLGTVLGPFQDDEVPGKIQMGSAWWFCDTDDGMYQQMRTLARLGLLGNFIGMLTDSRSFLSYTRHELFRRLMCNLIGSWVENGQYPNDEKALKKIVEGISYYNAKRYFSL